MTFYYYTDVAIDSVRPNQGNNDGALPIIFEAIHIRNHGIQKDDAKGPAVCLLNGTCERCALTNIGLPTPPDCEYDEGSPLGVARDMTCKYESIQGSVEPFTYVERVYLRQDALGLSIWCRNPRFTKWGAETGTVSVHISMNGQDYNEKMAEFSFQLPQTALSLLKRLAFAVIGLIVIGVVTGGIVFIVKKRTAKKVKFVEAFDKPSVLLARAHQTSISVRKYGYLMYPLWETQVEELGQYGIGIALYFQFHKYMALVFLIMFVLTSPICLLCFFGEGVPPLMANIDQTKCPNIDLNAATAKCRLKLFTVERFTIGNIGANASEPLRISDQLKMDKTVVTVVMSVFDTMAIFTFLIALTRLGRSQTRVVMDIQAETITISDYTVRVDGLPPDAVDADEIKDFFEERYGPVAAIAIGFDCAKLLALFNKRVNLAKKLDTAKASFAKTRLVAKSELIDKLQHQIREADATITLFKESYEFREVATFVTFDSDQLVEDVTNDYPSGFVAQLFQHREKRFRGQYRLAASKAPEPTNVYWENLEIFWFNQLQRKMITTVVVNIMLVGSFAAIAFSKGAQVGLTRSSVANCDTCPQMQKDVTWINYWKQRSDFVVCLRCYCAEGRANPNEFGKLDEFCDDNKITELQITLLGVIAVAGVIIINNILKRALVFFTIFEKNHTITDEEQGLAMKMFLAQFMNTSIIILIINADFSSVAYIQEHATLKTAFIGEFSDFTERWYRDVGLAMTSTLLTNSVAPHITVLTKWPIQIITQRLLAGGCVTQKALNALFTGPEYLLSERYGAM